MASAKKQLVACQFQCHEVHGLALLCSELAVFVMMRPGGEHEQTAFGASIELFTVWLRERGKAVFHDDDGGELSIKGSSHDTFFAGGNSWGDEHCTRLCSRHVAANFVLKLCFGVSSRDAYGKAVRSAEQGEIAYTAVGMVADAKVEEGVEVVRVSALHEQAAWIVFDVVDEGGEHVVGLANQVVVVGLEEETMEAAFAALARCFLLRHCRSVCRARITFPAASLLLSLAC